MSKMQTRKHLSPGLSNGASLARIELNLQEVVRSLARMELRQDGKIEIVERVLAADTRPDPPRVFSAESSVEAGVTNATDLRHVLADKLREAAKVAVVWEEAAIREWEPLAAGYHDGDGTVTAAIEGQYIEHRLAMSWRGQVQRMAENLSADTSPTELELRPGMGGAKVQATDDDAQAELAETRLVLEEMQGRTPDPQRSTVQLAREVVAQAERWRIDSEHYRSEASAAMELRQEVARRLALVGRLAALTMPLGAGVRTPFWPRVLTWSDAQVAAVERWLVDSTAEMPEVLRG